VLYAAAVRQAPLRQPPVQRGIDRETGRDEIDTAFNITFYGQTVSGHRVESQTASGILIFRYSAAAAAAAGSAR
jgi:hypothetical protein